jgi:hypothetical protein
MVLIAVLLILLIAAVVFILITSKRVRRADRQGSIAEARTGTGPDRHDA